MINNVEVGKHLNEAMMGMAAYSLLQRAIPDLRDGFKPVNRRIISSMYINKTINFTKSATVEGRVMQLHPHGGSYGSIVGLVQKDRQTLPFLVGKGSWGQYTSKDHTAAAGRYTEVKLGKNALEITKELKEKSVNLIPNYDGTQFIPEVLPVTYPTILTQAQDGMAIGFASAILPYNLLELREAIEKIYNNKEIGILYPDFATGGIILKDDLAAKEIMETGRGSIKIRAKIEVDENRLIINELPYSIKREAVIDKIVDLSRAGKLKEIIDVRDGTSFKGMKIVIKVRKNVNMQELIAKLYYLTPLETSVSANMNVLFNSYPMVVGTKKMLHEWISWRESIILISFENKLQLLKKDLHLVDGISKIFKSIDEVINIIRFEKDKEINEKLILNFNLDEQQADFISKLPVRSFNEDKLKKQIDEIENRQREIKELEKNIKDENFIKKELLDRMDNSIKVLEAPQRKTEIMKIGTETKMEIKKIIKKVEEGPVLETSIHLTKAGYLIVSDKEIEDVSLPRVGDEIIQTEKAFTNSRVILFLPDGKIGTLKANDFKDSIFLPIQFDQNPILGMLVENSTNEVILGFDNGKLTRIAINNFIINRKITENGYATESKVNFIKSLKAGELIKLKAISGDKEKVISPNDFSIKASRLSKGNMAFKPKDGQITTFEII